MYITIKCLTWIYFNFSDHMQTYVKGLESYIVSNSDVLNNSVIEILNVNDINSDRLGVCESGKSCGTCLSGIKECPGHTGHIKLAVPLPKIFFIKYLNKLLNSICYYCRKFKLKDPHILPIKITPTKWFDSLVYNNKKNKKCENCKLITPVFTRCDDARIFEARFYHLKSDSKHEITYDHVKSITMSTLLEFMNNLDISVMNVLDKLFINPDSLFWIYLPIPSINTRPNHKFISITKDKKDGSRDWSRFLKDIIRMNLKVKDHVLPEVCMVVHLNTKENYNNTKISNPLLFDLFGLISAFHSSKYKNKLQKTIRYGSVYSNVEDRFRNQKTGQIRQNIIARRVNQAFRCVLEGHQQYNLDIAVIPLEVAMNLTKRIRVNNLNKHDMYFYITNGPYKYPGANFIILLDDSEINLKHFNSIDNVDITNVKYVKRHLIENDIILVNRQPTLHRPSMLSFRIAIHKLNVIRLHYAVFMPLGADCDGDEVTGHVPQDPESEAEVYLLTNIYRMIYNNHKIWIKFSENSLIGASILSDDKLYSPDMCGNIIPYEMFTSMNIDYPRNPVSGTKLFSYLLPHDFNMTLKINGIIKLQIEDGMFISGVLNADTLNSSNGLIRHIHVRYINKPEIISLFIHYGYLMFQNIINLTGVSCSYSDCRLPFESSTRSQESTILNSYLNMNNKKEEVENIKTIQSVLCSHDKMIERSINENKTSNGIFRMIFSGAKGSINTIRQMSYSVGQMYKGMKRVLEDSSYSTKKKMKSLHDYGYINNAYLEGVSIPQYMVESSSTNENVMTKNKGTAVSGYTVRKMSNAMLSIKLNRNNQAIDCYGNVVWWLYGNDGYKGDLLIKVIFNGHVENFPFDIEECLLFFVKCKNETCVNKSCFSILKNSFLELSVKYKMIPNTRSTFYSYLNECLTYEKCKHLSTRKLLECFTLMRRLMNVSVGDYGEPVGIISSQSIGEPFTQLSLKTPHIEGKLSDTQIGGKKLSAYIDCNFSGGYTFIYFVQGTKLEDIHVYAMRSVRCTIMDICKSYSLEKNNRLIITMDYDKVIERCVFPDEIMINLMNNFKLRILDINMSVVRDETNNIIMTVDCNRDILNIDMTVQNILTHIIHGSKHISDFWVEYNYQNSGETVLVTVGNDLVFLITHPLVDKSRTWSTNIYEMIDVFGILNGRQCFIKMLSECMGLRKCRHIGLLVRLMTRSGVLTGLRVTDVKDNLPPTQRAAYEFGMKQMVSSCMDRCIDNASTISGASLCNKLIDVGTGQVTLLNTVVPCTEIVKVEQIQNFVMTYYKHDSKEGFLFFITIDDVKYIYIKNGKDYYMLYYTYDSINPIFKGSVFLCEISQHRSCEFSINVIDCYSYCSVDIRCKNRSFRIRVFNIVTEEWGVIIDSSVQITKYIMTFTTPKMTRLKDVHKLAIEDSDMCIKVRFIDTEARLPYRKECNSDLIWTGLYKDLNSIIQYIIN